MLHNYRPISKLPFIAKVLEKVVMKQLTTILEERNILDKFPPGFQSHATEIALHRVSNDLLMRAHCGECAVLV